MAWPSWSLYEWVTKILNTPADSDIGYFVEVDFKYSDNIKEKTDDFPFCPEKNVIPNDKYNDYMKKIKPKNCAKAENLLCDWTDKKRFNGQFTIEY